jgi:hypothetical protein
MTKEAADILTSVVAGVFLPSFLLSFLLDRTCCCCIGSSFRLYDPSIHLDRVPNENRALLAFRERENVREEDKEEDEEEEEEEEDEDEEKEAAFPYVFYI